MLLERKTGARGAKPSLLQKWFGTWQDINTKGTEVAPGLMSNRRAAPELALDAPHNGKVRWDEVGEDARRQIVEQFGDAAQARAFLDVFRFRLDEPALRELEEGAYDRFLRLGGTLGGWYSLEKAVREWVNTKCVPPPDGHIYLEEVRHIAKLKAHPVRLHTFRPLPPSSSGTWNRNASSTTACRKSDAALS